MPRGKTAVTTQHLRDMIDAEELIAIVLDNVTSPRKKPMNPSKMNGIKMLLNKVLPDLKAIEQTTTIEGEVDLNISVEFLE